MQNITTNSFKDCPICGQKDALPFVPSKPYTSIHGPSHDSSGSKIIGNASLVMTNSYWEVTKHAKVCLDLFYVKEMDDRKHILDYHLGQANFFHGDIYPMSQYEKALSEANFCLSHERVGGQNVLFIVHKHNKMKRYMETKAKTLDQASEEIRQKLLNGEGVILENGDAYQLMRTLVPETAEESKKDTSFGVEAVLKKIATQTQFTFFKSATRSSS
jgi:hypothetical protein